jgi:hypothetical protein
MSIRLEELIVTTMETRGDGVKTPFRRVTQVYSKDGELVAENDPSPDIERKLQEWKDGAKRLSTELTEMVAENQDLRDELRALKGEEDL